MQSVYSTAPADWGTCTESNNVVSSIHTIHGSDTFSMYTPSQAIILVNAFVVSVTVSVSALQTVGLILSVSALPVSDSTC